MRRVVMLMLVLSTVLWFLPGTALAKVGDIKPGIYVSLDDTADRGDVELVEFWNWRISVEDENPLLSANFGGSLKGESLLLALLFDLQEISLHMPSWLGQWASLPIEAGPYASYQFDSDGMGTNSEDFGLCATLWRKSF